LEARSGAIFGDLHRMRNYCYLATAKQCGMGWDLSTECNHAVWHIGGIHWASLPYEIGLPEMMMPQVYLLRCSADQ
jgi:hypothetical protein